jgi:hypothetical protein
MKRVGVIGTAALVLLLGVPAFGYSQEGQRGKQEKQSGLSKQKGKQQQRGKYQQRGKQQQQQQDHYRQQPQGTQRQQSQDYYRQRPQGTQWKESQDLRQQRVWQEHRASRWNSEHRTWRQRGGYNGYLVPDVYFRSHYGPRHSFRVYNRPFMVVGGRPRFQYGNYWFSMVDPYPEYWGHNWYQTDDVYVEYVDNGYYLFNRSYPQRTGIAVSISF